MNDKPSTLSKQLQDTVQGFMAGLPDTDRTTVMGSFEKLHASDVASNAINTNDSAPDFELSNATGEPVKLSDALQKGPVVLSFYRGGWCPFCNLELQALQSRLPAIKALGATLVAVTPETPDNSLSTAEKHGLEFEVLSDIGNQVARDYGLLFHVYEEMRPLYLKWGLDVPACNGDDSWELPVPATYLIDMDGIVRSAYVEKDYTRRMDPAQIEEELRKLQA